METPALPTSTGLRVSGDGLAPALGPYVRKIYEERTEVAEAMGRRICRVALKPLFLMLPGRPSCRRPFPHPPTRCAGLSPCSLC